MRSTLVSVHCRHPPLSSFDRGRCVTLKGNFSFQVSKVVAMLALLRTPLIHKANREHSIFYTFGSLLQPRVQRSVLKIFNLMLL